MIRVPRKVFTLGEVGKRWNVPALDVQRAALDGHLRPCVMVDVDLLPVAVVDGVAAVLQDAIPQRRHEYLYPTFGKQIGPFNARYQLLCDMAQPVEGCQLWQLPEPVTLDELMGLAVVTADDLAEAEAALRPIKGEEALSTKEKNSMSIVIATLYIDAYGWEVEHERCKGIAEIVRAASDCGMSITDTTVRKVLLDSLARAKPGN